MNEQLYNEVTTLFEVINKTLQNPAIAEDKIISTKIKELEQAAAGMYGELAFSIKES